MAIAPGSLITTPVRILSQRGNVAFGEVQIRDWSRPERIRNGLRFLGTAWGLAIVAVFIPGLHFLLVPTLLLAGPIGGFIVSQRPSSRLGGKGACPDCGAELPLVRGAVRWPFADLCGKCQAAVSVEPRE